MAQIYVDNIVFRSTPRGLVEDFVSIIKNESEMNMIGELNFFLGLQIKQIENIIFISQTIYDRNLIKKFGLKNTKSYSTPMSSTLKLEKDENGKCIDQSLFRSMIGFLLYLRTSRPDISFSVGVCARYQASPK